MRIVLKVASGEYNGRMTLLRVGQTTTVGRTERADVAVPHDDHMSGVHFSITCSRDGGRIQDLNSSNGTQVNGDPIIEHVLQDGDEIQAGHTKFVVQFERPAPVPTADIRATAIDPNSPSRRMQLAGEVASSTIATATAVADKALQLVQSSPQRPYADALADDDVQVRHAALEAAVWTKQPWLLDYCCAVAESPTIENLHTLSIFAVLATPKDLEQILTVGRTHDLTSKRFDVLATYGHPSVVRDLLVGIESKDANTAVAAGKAFTKMTGADIDSENREALPPEDGSEPDDFEQEFLEEEFLPNPSLAHRHWKQVREDFSKGIRWRRGIDIAKIPVDQLPPEIDMEARWHAHMRAKYEGKWDGLPAELLRFTAPVPRTAATAM